MFRLLFVTLILYATFSIPVFAASITSTTEVTSSAPRWTEIDTPHFQVFSDAGRETAVNIAAHFEQMRLVQQMLFPSAAVDRAPVVVVAMKDRKGFQSLVPESFLQKGQLDLTGLFMHWLDRNIILVRIGAGNEHPYAVVYHEYTHYMTSGAAWMPLWLSEGLAEFNENTEIREGSVLLGEPSLNYILYLRRNALLPLATLFTVTSSAAYAHEARTGSVFYAEAWALTHYLKMTDQQSGINRLQKYAALMAQGTDSLTAAQQAFGDLGLLQKALAGYVRRSEFSMFRINLSTAIDTSAFQVKQLSEPEAGVMLADVMIRNKRTAEAGQLLKTSLRDDPGDPSAYEAMGFLKYREHDTEGAKQWYGKAVQLDPNNFRTRFYNAASIARIGNLRDDDLVESDLRASIQLNPEFAPAYDALAFFFLARQRNLDEARRMNARAIELEPGKVSYLIDKASILKQQGEVTGAIHVLKEAMKVARTPQDAATVEDNLKQLQTNPCPENKIQ
ncbi:MAG: DUF1570 domain-containing protein [Acidobacteriaceae bacterium]|nr:DUF1570 domain-containing protein [Acidobacteriaceae bacterium]